MESVRTNILLRKASILFATLIICLSVQIACAETKVVILGTGTPVPDAKRSGPGVAIIYDGASYVFDAGGGVVQRAIEASQRLGIKELYPTNIKHLFFTHLHSDHILDYPELAATYWWRRTEKLKAYGPVGLKEMTKAVYAMLDTDTKLRISGNQPVKNPDFYQVDVTEISKDGVVFNKGGIKIEVFTVSHGDIKPAYGYKITTPDKTVVISGDTTYNENVIKQATGADILIHEVMSEEGWRALPKVWQTYHASSHTLSSELAKVANKSRPKLLVLTHILYYGAPVETAETEVKALYNGKVILANDLDIF